MVSIGDGLEMELVEQPDIMNLLSARLIPGSVGVTFGGGTIGADRG